MAINIPLVITLLTFYWYGLCKAEYVRNGTHSFTLGNYTKVLHCIETYTELDLYVRQNSILKDKLMNAFFVTGEIPSEYVTITYNFEASNSIPSDTTNLTKQNDVNCSSHQSKYIWSDNFLYLLGPRVLFWFTLTVVEVREGRVSIDLPCLCCGAFNDLLSRLTYMV